MTYKTFTFLEICEALRDVMHFESDDILIDCATAIQSGKSVILDALAYLGNSRWEHPGKKDRYRFKMIIPVFDNDHRIYSTDLFKVNSEHARNACYGIYSHTRQMATSVVQKVDPVISIERFGHGYQDGKYGIIVHNPSKHD